MRQTIKFTQKLSVWIHYFGDPMPPFVTSEKGMNKDIHEVYHLFDSFDEESFGTSIFNALQ